MMQKNSSCKLKLRTLVLQCSVRQAPLYAIAFLAMLVFQPVYMLLDIRSRTRFTDMSMPDMYNSVIEDLHDALIVNFPTAGLLVILALIAGISAFRYLHVKNQTDFFHALPIRRGQLFASHVLTGILAVIPAYIIGVLLSCAVVAAHGYGEILSVQEILFSLLLHSTGFLLVYAVAVLSAIVCGNTLVSILVCAWFQFGVFAGWAGLDSLLYILMPARTRGAEVPLHISPMIEVFQLVGGMADDTISSIQLGKETANCLISVIVVLALAYFLNHIRASENTGMSIAFPALQLPFKLYMMSVVGIFAGLIFENMTSSWGMLFLGMAIGAFLTACIVEIVYDMDFHSLFNRWKSTLVYAVAAVAVVSFVSLDVTGWNSKLPDRSDIVSAQLISDYPVWACTNEAWDKKWDYADFDHSIMSSVREDSGNYGTMYMDQDPDTLLDIAEVQPLRESDNIDRIYASAQLGAEAMKHGRSQIASKRNEIADNGDNAYETYLVRFQLANGKTFARQYILPVNNKELADNGEAVRYSKEYLSTNTPEAIAQSRKDLVKAIDVFGNATDEYTTGKHIDNQQAISTLLDTLQKESLQRDKTYMDSHAPEYYLCARGKWRMQNEDANAHLPDSDTNGDDMIVIPIYSYETQTLSLIRKYVDAMPKTFTVDNVAKISVFLYVSDDGKEEYQDFTQPADIAKLLPALIPNIYTGNVDPTIYSTRNYLTANVYLKDGEKIVCECYADRTGGVVQ